jgi:hypothetical protein
VYVDDATRGLTSAAIAYEDTGLHELKGKSEPMRLFSAVTVVAELGGGQRVDGLEAPLTGRDRELRLLKELFHSTAESQRPRLVVLDGDAGVGKSRLAWEFEKYADGLTQTVRWHRGRCLSYGEGVSFWAIAEAVRARLGLTEGDSGDVVLDRLEAGLEEFVPDLEERDWLRPRLAALVRAGHGAGFIRQDLFLAWTTWFERVAEDGNAVVLVIDDAQYADDALLDFADHLLSTAQAGIFVLALARPELLVRRAALGGRRTTVVRLDPLDDAAMGSLVGGLVDGLSDASRDALVARADGVPLFAVETVRALIDRDLVVPRDGRYVSATGGEVDFDAIGAPASLQALVAARLDALSPDERLVVADASVLGAVFTRDGLLALGVDSQHIDEHLDSLQRKEILTIQSDRFAADRGQFRFLQLVVRQVAYATQSRRDRKARHLAAANHLAGLPDADGDLAAVTSRHLLDSVDASSSDDTDVAELSARACVLLEKAAARVGSLGSHAEARRLLEQAIERTTVEEDLARLHLAAAISAEMSGDLRASVEHSAEAVARYDALGRPVDAGRAAGIQCYTLCLLSDTATALEVGVPRWEALDGVPGSDLALLELCKGLGRAYGDRGDLASVIRLSDRRIELAEATGDPRTIALMLSSVSTRYAFAGAPATGRAMLEASAGMSREHDFPDILALALNNLASLLLTRDPAAAATAAVEGIEVARRAGAAGMLDYLRINKAIALFTTGRLNDARAAIDDAAESMTISVIRLAMLALDTRVADALGAPLPAVPAPDSGDTQGDLALRADLALWRAMRDGDRAAAARIAEDELPHVLLATGIDDDFHIYWPALVRAAVDAADLKLAERMLRPIETASLGVVSPVVKAEWYWLRGLVAALRGDTASVVEADFRTGIEALDEVGAIGMRARAQEDLARWLVDQRRTADAERFVALARATYEQIGALGWLARLDAWTTTAVTA